MADKEFCLLHEPWIRVITEEAKLKEVSLVEIFQNAHQYKDLAGEIAMQNIAMLRFLLSILSTVLLRYGDAGQKKTLETPDEVLDRYEEVWKAKMLPAQALESYLMEWEENFWLIHPETPFYQIPCKEGEMIGTESGVAKLNGELFESKNQVQLFAGRNGKARGELTFAEAARWLLFLNAFDDCGAKKPSPKECWVSKLGLTVAKGRTLFETLMLNCQLLTVNAECWPDHVPYWEQPEKNNKKLQEIPRPGGIASLFSVRSRKIHLVISPDKTVTECQVAAGDYFEGDNYFVEPMTLWQYTKTTEKETWTPKKYDPGRQAWQEFPTLLNLDDDGCSPGIIRWIHILQDPDVGILDKDLAVTFETCSVHYVAKGCKIAMEVHDELSFHAGMLNQLNRKWQVMVREMIRVTEEAAKEVEKLANEIGIASGARTAAGNKAREQFYYRIDSAFRTWLSGLSCSGEEEKLNEARKDWRMTAKQTALDCAKEIVARSSGAAFAGRKPEKKIGGGKHYSVPEAYNSFFLGIRKIFGERGE